MHPLQASPKLNNKVCCVRACLHVPAGLRVSACVCRSLHVCVSVSIPCLSLPAHVCLCVSLCLCVRT